MLSPILCRERVHVSLSLSLVLLSSLARSGGGGTPLFDAIHILSGRIFALLVAPSDPREALFFIAPLPYSIVVGPFSPELYTAAMLTVCHFIVRTYTDFREEREIPLSLSVASRLA
jgi:hypothetical protein